MKRFIFRLESAMAYRKKRMETEQARMEDLEQQRRGLVRNTEEVQKQWQEAQDLVLQAASVETVDLAALDNFHHATEQRKARLASEIRQLQERLNLQRRQLIEATREFRLLEKLKARREREWSEEMNKELENEASDFYLARWGKEEDL
jgi:hypothetical protein